MSRLSISCIEQCLIVGFLDFLFHYGGRVYVDFRVNDFDAEKRYLDRIRSIDLSRIIIIRNGIMFLRTSR